MLVESEYKYINNPKEFELALYLSTPSVDLQIVDFHQEDAMLGTLPCEDIRRNGEEKCSGDKKYGYVAININLSFLFTFFFSLRINI